MSEGSLKTDIDIGPTDEMSLRVSVATLVRVLLEHSRNAISMVALERRATLHDARTEEVEVKSKPFGGAIRIHDPGKLQHLIGEFRYDSKESFSEHDFRIFIRPADWERVLEFCLGHLGQPDDPVLESDPTRELTEEFADTLRLALKQNQFTLQTGRMIVEDQPSATEYIHARGYPTVRIYRIFEARIVDPALASAMIDNSERYSDHDLGELALAGSRNSGPGRANAVLTLPFKELHAAYAAIPNEARNKPISFYGHHLDETVAAILDDVTVPKYRRL